MIYTNNDSLTFAECFVEIFCERMPIGDMPDLDMQVSHLIKSWLTSYYNTGDCTVEVGLSAHRLFFCISKIPLELYKYGRQVKGPKIDAFEEIVQRFAEKMKQKIEDLAQDNGYWIATEADEGQQTKKALPELIEYILVKAVLPYRMSWGKDIDWIRPIKRIICILNGAPLFFTLNKLGIKSSMESLFFLNNENETFCFGSYEEYINWLKSKNIIVNRDKRLNYVKGLIYSMLEQGEDEMLDAVQLEFAAQEISNKSEFINIHRCDYVDDFILPRSIREHIIIAEEGCLPIFKDQQTVIFAPSTQLLADNGACFRKGICSSLYNKFHQIRKYWSNSISKSYEDYIEIMKVKTLSSQIGSLHDQLLRMQKWLKCFAGDNEQLQIAVKYLNFDQLMDICLENPSLGGIASAEYVSILLGISSEDHLCQSLRDSVFPRYDEEIPSKLNKDAALLSICRRLDCLVGLASVYNIPKGSSDPLGLRREVFAVLKLGFHIENLPKFSTLLKKTISLYEEQEITLQPEIYNQLMIFFQEKHEALLSKIDPVYGKYFSISDIKWNEQKLVLDFINSNNSKKLFESIKTIRKRINGILRADFGEGGEETSMKFFNPLIEILSKESTISAEYIDKLCNAVIVGLDQNKPIRLLRPEQTEVVKKQLSHAMQILDEYIRD